MKNEKIVKRKLKKVLKTLQSEKSEKLSRTMIVLSVRSVESAVLKNEPLWAHSARPTHENQLFNGQAETVRKTRGSDDKISLASATTALFAA